MPANMVPATPTFDAQNAPQEGVRRVLDLLGPTTLVAIQPTSRHVAGHWAGRDNIDAAATWAANMNQNGHNIYFTPNEPRHGVAKKPARADIVVLRAAFADVDAKDGRSMDQALAAIQALPWQPSFVIMSGGGYQPVWKLAAPLSATPETVRRIEAVGKSIAAKAGGDRVQNIDRILRLPFSVNYPNAQKQAAGRTVCLSGVWVP